MPGRACDATRGASLWPPEFFFSSRRRHTRYWRHWSSDVCSSDLVDPVAQALTQSQPAVVSADPADTTPNVVDGKVTAILPMGNRIYVGGTFTQVKNAGDDRIDRKSVV